VSGSKLRHTRNNYFSYAHEATLVKSGDDFFKRAVSIIERSKHTIHFQTYIFIGDDTGNLIIDALAKAVKRGVRVFLLVDAYGSNDLSSHAIKQILKSGIEFRKYSPLFNKYRIRFGRRLHHKILLSDEAEALIGGINVENKYHIAGTETPWLDYAVYIKGSPCHYIRVICESLWRGKGYRGVRKKMRYHLASSAIDKTAIPIKISQNDWLRRKDRISKSIRHELRHSHISITLMASYFLPDKKIRTLLKNASKRNVKVRLILPGISDVQLAKRATTYLYAWMLRNNIEIYEWNDTILHGKVNLVDDKWASIGSFNINHLSRFSSVETNVEVFDAKFCNTVKKELDTVISKCSKVINTAHLQKMTQWEKFTCWCAFYFTRFLFRLEFAVLSKE